MNVLITGAAGGIGSTLCLHLLKKGVNVFAFDNFNNGYIENLQENKKLFCEIIFGDIRDSSKIEKCLKQNKIDTIIHMAAITSLPECETNPTECIDVNVSGSISILNAARKMGQNVIMASTSAVYENNKKEESPFQETLEINPTLFYSLSKKMMEDSIASYIKNYKMNITTLRFFNVFGPRQDIHRKSPPLINYLVRQIKKNESAIFYSDGNQVRDYVHVDDVVSMIDNCLYRPKNEIFNVCTSTLTSVLDIISYAETEFNIKLNYSFQKPVNFWKGYDNIFEGRYSLNSSVLEKEVNKFSLGSFEKSKKIIGWNPNTNIKELMMKTMRENYENYFCINS